MAMLAIRLRGDFRLSMQFGFEMCDMFSECCLNAWSVKPEFTAVGQ